MTSFPPSVVLGRVGSIQHTINVCIASSQGGLGLPTVFDIQSFIDSNTTDVVGRLVILGRPKLNLISAQRHRIQPALFVLDSIVTFSVVDMRRLGCIIWAVDLTL